MRTSAAIASKIAATNPALSSGHLLVATAHGSAWTVVNTEAEPLEPLAHCDSQHRDRIDPRRANRRNRTGQRRHCRTPSAPRSATDVKRELQRLRYAGRRLWSLRTITALAVVTLAPAIGINAGAFSLVNAMLWRTLP